MITGAAWYGGTVRVGTGAGYICDAVANAPRGVDEVPTKECIDGWE